jgi:anti-sigma regulatory factor (Ser/Thr protein kinase)
VRQARCSIPADPAQLAAARQFAQARLHEWGIPSLADSTKLVVSELATNAVLHGGSAPELSMKLDGRVLRIEVRDTSAALPRVKPHSETATTGRGMVIVEALSSNWGADTDDGGKVVWCELPAPKAERRSPAASQPNVMHRPGRAGAHNLLLCRA